MKSTKINLSGGAAPPSVASVATVTAKQWVLYLLECQCGKKTSLYAGITNDIKARLAAHVSGRGAKYTQANKPLRVIATRDFDDRAQASSAEWHLKQQPRARKLGFLHTLGTPSAELA